MPAYELDGRTPAPPPTRRRNESISASTRGQRRPTPRISMPATGRKKGGPLRGRACGREAGSQRHYAVRDGCGVHLDAAGASRRIAPGSVTLCCAWTPVRARWETGPNTHLQSPRGPALGRVHLHAEAGAVACISNAACENPPPGCYLVVECPERWKASRRWARIFMRWHTASSYRVLSASIYARGCTDCMGACASYRRPTPSRAQGTVDPAGWKPRLPVRAKLKRSEPEAGGASLCLE